MKFTRNAVLIEISNFVNLGLSSVHTSDELGSFSITATIIGRPIDESNWLLPKNLIGEVNQLEISGRGQSKTIFPKLVFKLGGGINILGINIVL